MQQIPTLIEGHADLAQPLPVGVGGLLTALLLEDPVLFVGELADPSEHVRVVHLVPPIVG